MKHKLKKRVRMYISMLSRSSARRLVHVGPSTLAINVELSLRELETKKQFHGRLNDANRIFRIDGSVHWPFSDSK
jgi:hypothetical protein